jgi:hypothetical protein
MMAQRVEGGVAGRMHLGFPAYGDLFGPPWGRAPGADSPNSMSARHAPFHPAMPADPPFREDLKSCKLGNDEAGNLF